MRKEILKEIDELVTNNCEKCPYFGKQSNEQKYCLLECEVGRMLKIQGDRLLEINEIKQRETLNKGADMTTEEILYLRNKGVSRNEIGKHAKIQSEDRRKFFESLEGRVRRGGKMLEGMNV